MTNWSVLFLSRSSNTPFFHVSYNYKTSFLSSWSDSLFLRCVCLFVGESSSSRSYSGWDETAECLAQTAPQVRPTVDQLSADVAHSCCSDIPFHGTQKLALVSLCVLLPAFLCWATSSSHRFVLCCWSVLLRHFIAGSFRNISSIKLSIL